MQHLKLFPLTLALLAFSLYPSAQPASEDLAMSTARYFPLEKSIYYKIGDNQTIPLKLIQYGPANRVFCFNMHDNEYTAVNAARTVLETWGGTLLKIENRSQRVIRFSLRGRRFAFDPNRIFSRTGIEQTLRENGGFSQEALREVERFAERMLQLIPDSVSCVIALHNNTEGAYSVNSYLPGGDRRKDAAEVSAADNQDPDDIVLTTRRDIFEHVTGAGYNAILQDNEKVKKDGSLSVYCGEKGLPYANIETQHGRQEQYRQMLECLLQYLEKAHKKSAETNSALPGDPAGTRTQGPNIKSVVLYQLSYEISLPALRTAFPFWECKNKVSAESFQNFFS